MKFSDLQMERLLEVLGWIHDDRYRWFSPYKWGRGKTFSFTEACEEEKNRVSDLMEFFDDET